MCRVHDNKLSYSRNTQKGGDKVIQEMFFASSYLVVQYAYLPIFISLYTSNLMLN